MPARKYRIDTPQDFSDQQAKFLKQRGNKIQTAVFCPLNRDMAHVVRVFSGPVILKILTQSGPYMLELRKNKLLKELLVVGDLPCDFKIDQQDSDDDKLCIVRLTY